MYYFTKTAKRTIIFKLYWKTYSSANIFLNHQLKNCKILQAKSKLKLKANKIKPFIPKTIRIVRILKIYIFRNKSKKQYY